MKQVSSMHFSKLIFSLAFFPLLAAAFTMFVLMASLTGCSSGLKEELKNSGDVTPGLYLVSSGNGDPDNITLRALNIIKHADIVFCRKDAVKDFPKLLKGKQIEETSVNVHRTFMTENKAGYPEALREVQRVSGIVRSAVAEGKTVVVLDSGDPTIYGPNMWFMEVFEDLSTEIIPGVSSFNCANAALKKGIAAGEHTRSIILSNGKDIGKLAEARTSMVFFTMHLSLQDIVANLKPHYGGDTPIAIVANAGYSDKEQIYRGTLDTILEKTKGEKLPIHLVYVGDFLTKRYGIEQAKQNLSGKKDIEPHGHEERMREGSQL
ncbi:MAG: SAM-dependent methyltransferase [Desulfosalsimonas sp.]